MKARDNAALFLLLAALVAAFGGAWLPGRTFFARDLTYLFHPMHVWTAENLQAGRLPLWNPFVSGGVPWLGQPQTAVFYPGNIVFWLFPFAGGLKLFSALHFFLSALGGYLWTRAAGGSPRAALAAALLWSLNGFWRARVEFPPLLAVLSWTPWIGLFLRRPSALFLALTGALSLTAGYWPQVLWGGLLVLFADGGAGFPRWAKAGGAALGAALLSSVSLLPGLELLFRSGRAAGMARDVAGLYAFSPTDWAGLLFPWASAMERYAYTGEKFFWVGCFFTGFVGAFLAALSFRRAPGRRKWFWAGAFLLGALLSLGAATPFFRLLLAARVRYPGQYAFWMTGAVLAAVTAGASFWERGLRPRTAALLVLALAAELLVYGAGMAPTIASDYFHRRPPWIETVQGAAGRLFMTPRAVGDAGARGRDWEETWTRLREKGLSLSTLPYHVRNLNPIGFSLNPASTERLLADLYGGPTYQAAIPLLDRLDVRWVAAPSALSGTDLRLAGTAPWFLYERTHASSASGPEGNHLKVDAPDGAGKIARTSVIYDPGWAVAGPRRGEILNDGGLLSVRAEPGEGPLELLFRPKPFFVGLLGALLSLVALTAWGLWRAGCL